MGDMELEHWEEYRRQYIRMHGKEPGIAGSTFTLRQGRSYRTGGVTKYNEANKRGSDAPAEKRQDP